jgi:hypothetical protein
MGQELNHFHLLFPIRIASPTEQLRNGDKINSAEDYTKQYTNRKLDHSTGYWTGIHTIQGLPQFATINLNVSN